MTVSPSALARAPGTSTVRSSAIRWRTGRRSGGRAGSGPRSADESGSLCARAWRNLIRIKPCSLKDPIVGANGALGEETALASDPLQFGQLLMGKRSTLKRLAQSLTSDAELAGAAIRCTLCEAWHQRSLIDNERGLDRLLTTDLREKIRSGPGECGVRWPRCTRFEARARSDGES